MLKTIRNTPLMREQFKQVLGRTTQKEVPNKLKPVFEALANKPEFSGKLINSTEVEWRKIKSVKDILDYWLHYTIVEKGGSDDAELDKYKKCQPDFEIVLCDGPIDAEH